MVTGCLSSLLLLIIVVNCVPQQKFSILSNSEVTADSDRNDKFKGNINGPGEVVGNYQGVGGVIDQKRGDGKAKQNGNGDNFQAVGPDGRNAKGTVDKRTKVAKLIDDRGNTVDAKVSDPKNGNAVAGGKEYKVTRDDSGNVNVLKPNTKDSLYKVSNARGNTDQVVATGDKINGEIRNKYQTKKDGSGKLAETDLSESENIIPNIPVGQRRETKMKSLGGSGSQLTIGNRFGGTSDSGFGSIGLAGGVTTDDIQVVPCLTNSDGTDLFGSSGFDIDRNSLKWDLITTKGPSGNDVYSFPSCFNMHANLRIPPNTDISKLGGQAKVTVVQAGGDLNCDKTVECSDQSTRNRPTGPCFFCNFCTKEQKKGAFGLGSDTNLCQARAGQILPFDWKVCPPEGSSRFSPFSNSLQRQTGDVVAQLQLFMKSSSNAWTQVACKKATFAYRVGLVNGRQYGSSAKSAGSADVSDHLRRVWQTH